MDSEARTTALAFNERINASDLEGLSELMTDDHTMTDAADNVLRGKEECREAWCEFFARWPDYRNIFERITVHGSTVVMQGRSECSDEQLRTQSIWIAETSGGKVRSWCIRKDTAPNRELLGIWSL